MEYIFIIDLFKYTTNVDTNFYKSQEPLIYSFVPIEIEFLVKKSPPRASSISSPNIAIFY